MKKYKLKKDLPLAKAGTEVFINKNINMICKYGDNECVIPIAHIIISEKDEWLEEIEQKSIWELKDNDEYYTFEDYGEGINITKSYWFDTSFHLYRRDLGLCFITKEETEKELKKRIAIRDIKKYCWENNININFINQTELYTFCISFGQIKIYSVEDVKIGTPIGYFSHENAQKILDNFEEELKIILN